MPGFRKIPSFLFYLAVLAALLYPICLAFNELSWISGVVVVLVLLVPLLFVIVVLLAHFLPKLPEEEPDEEWIVQEGILEQVEAARQSAWGTADAIIAEHADELDERLSGQRRMKVLALWRGAIDERAHAYDDLVAGHENSRWVAELHAEAIMLAWSLGYAAARGWIDGDELELNVGSLGRALRHQVLELGLEIYELGIDLPLVVDETLAAIAALGREDGSADA